ncbi:AzlD domain-containing protein [Microlunatus sp. GCM10028923]|uniref:AzlD domain-containing protein n=1 Tax=Microlunatus sp. GCM10028923 TaxID=3273400 RepID=UPI003616B698
MNPLVVIIGALCLALGTYAFRLTGPLLAHRIDLSERVQELIDTSTVVLLLAVVATTATTEAQHFAGVARPVGVLVAGVLAWRRAPFVITVTAAAAVAAGLRLLGIP